MTNMEPYFSGAQLYGDDFDQEQIDDWFVDEQEGYAELGAAEHGSVDSYFYHSLNQFHGFRHLPPMRYRHALGLGSAYGAEFLPLIDRIEKLTILEPSQQLRSSEIAGLPIEYVDPAASGSMAFPDETFDLVLSLGVLHHVPNVSHVIREIGRVTTPGGVALVREPVISMGDWRTRRPGLTLRERGIPSKILDRAFESARFEILHQSPCIFPTTRILNKYGWGVGNPKGVKLDSLLCRLTDWNRRYHATNRWHKVRPSSRFYVLQKH
ncbi:class I SAM-dependent methyltransferase [Mycolicibacterium neoaurum]|uniref:Methyltransferase, UbiE/COQ5 family protein n=1 Tax=Mycolicibacterium neoaurum TaxID=1795 RepID=A0AAV2WRX3_MYCNE|nr:class I SAM-dependent methyltransferase [Mycolicibacterium neoaurum]TLH59051.1 class I SAM-dependent methyltransferase [Mycolicibacterium neoaurum]CDQ46935.1 methyltransferase, UbiE/COQ5 family protein [Mycolicibacterium neoaurum]